MRELQSGRRRFMTIAAGLAAAPYVRTSRAAGTLNIGVWDHWVPGANAVFTGLCNEWAAREKVELKIDFITTQGNKLMLTIASEAQAGAGHDVLAMPTFWATGHERHLEPVDDVMATLIKQNGKVVDVVEYLGRQDGRWLAVPATPGSQIKPPCGRIDLFKKHVGLDLTKMYPAGHAPDASLADRWTWDTFATAAEKCRQAGHPFGLGLGQTTDSTDWVGALFAAYGAELVDAKGEIRVRTDAVREVLEFAKRLAHALAPDVSAWDDASNNKWLISGKGALIMNPPSAWAVAKRDAPKVAEQLWTFPSPKGPKGRVQPGLPFYWGIWKFSRNKAAAKSLLTYLSLRPQVEKLVNGSGGFDIPGFSGLRDFGIWSREGPPKGTLYNYPPRSDQIVAIAAAPAPTAIANQIYAQGTLPKMVARYAFGGESLARTLDRTESELEGMMRT
ncbi:MAG: extracellular solute-binding protein [Betaproteobacteria bacterium]|nr:extracellular solute-binding protein [Betaproteobacteria bacterium]